MDWTKIEDRKPELVLLNSTTSVSRYHLIYVPKYGQVYGYRVKTLEGGDFWVVGPHETEMHPTYWLEIKDPV